MSRFWLPCRVPVHPTTTTSRSALSSFRLVGHRSFALPSRWSDGTSADIFSDNFINEAANAFFFDDTDEDEASELPKEHAFDQREGWREQITPSITVEWRPLIPNKRIRHRSKGPAPWQEGSLESELLRAGVPREDVEKVAAAASAWRVTPLGRPLIDRRRRSRVQRNIRRVVDHLELVCGVPLGLRGVAEILMKAPQILLCKVSLTDQWSSRVIELAAFMHEHGHCQIPQKWPVSPTLGRWAERQRWMRDIGQLSEERMQILHALKFQFNPPRLVMDREWISHFEAFTDWMSQNIEQNRIVDAAGLRWFEIGGWPAARLAVWAIIQRELRSGGVLPNDAIQRLDEAKFEWTVDPGSRRLRDWLSGFGKLAAAVHNNVFSRSKSNTSYSTDDITTFSKAPYAMHDRKMGVDRWSEAQTSPSRAYAISARKGIPKICQLRDVLLDPEVTQWLEQQRFLWRHKQLSVGQVALFYALGVDLDSYSRFEWVHCAHLAAKFVNDFDIDVPSGIEDPMLIPERKSGPHLLIMPKDIVSVSRGDDIVERVELKAYQAMTNEVDVLEAQPETIAAVELLRAGGSFALLEKLTDNNPPWQNAEHDQRIRSPVCEWILAQRALNREHRLSHHQIEYLTALGLVWLLDDKIANMDDVSWLTYFERIQSSRSVEALPLSLEIFLFYQRALHRIGFLSAKRKEALESIGFSFAFDVKTQEDGEWDRHLSAFLKRQIRPTQDQEDTDEDFRNWIQRQEKRITSLLPVRAMQLRVLKGGFMM